MGYYSDPTANMAVGNVNREFSKYEKKAKKLWQLYEEGKISEVELEQAKSQFKGVFSHVLEYSIPQKAV